MSTIQKKVLCYTVIVIAFILLGNTNNDMTIFIQRIFPPIKIGAGTLYYAAAIPMVMIYYALKQLNTLQERWFLNTTFRRLITWFLIINLFSSVWEIGLMVYKSTQSGLDSIYLTHEESSVSFEFDLEEINWNSHITVKNCGNEDVAFKVKVRMLDEETGHYDVLDDVVKEDGYLVFNQEVYLKADDSTIIRLDESFIREVEETTDETPISGSGTVRSPLEYILFNDEQEVVFTID